MADGFEIAQRRSIRVEIAERRDLLDALLSPISIDEARFERAAARTGFLDASTHVVAAVGPLLPLLDGGPEHIRVQRQLSQRYPDRPWASAVVRNHLVVVAGDTEPQDLEVLARVVTGERSDPAMVGIGDQVSELNAVSESYEQAMEALRLGSIFGLGPVVHHDRLLVYRLLAADRSVTDALAEQVLEPLTARSNDALLATLAAFVESNGNRAHVARMLSVGTRTVGYRLDRIAELTGHSVGDPDGRLTLELAARSSALVEHRRSGGENAR